MVVSFDPLYFCVVCCDFSILISNFIDLILLSFFFLMSLANGLFILFIFSKNQLLVFLIFATVSFFFLIYFSSDFYDFFPSTNFGVLLFLVTVDVKLGCLFDVFLVSWGQPVMLWISLLGLLLLNPIGFGLLCFHFHLFLCIFLFHFWFLPRSFGYSEVCCLASIFLYF